MIRFFNKQKQFEQDVMEQGTVSYTHLDVYKRQMGPLLTDAITRYDLNVVQTLVIIYAALGIIGVFLGDILMMTLDPRIKLTDKGGSR